ncbi:MAG: hypothetical protein IPP63_00365 [Chloracidobacterium sp.]|nr:hypothetical protein [Chloracidobacterium sp.]
MGKLIQLATPTPAHTMGAIPERPDSNRSSTNKEKPNREVMGDISRDRDQDI